MKDDDSEQQSGVDACGGDEQARRVSATRAALASEFHVEAAFVGVPKLARILGIAPSTIYGCMRRGAFFIPYRMFNSMAMVSMQDLAEWHCSTQGVIPAAALSRRSLAASVDAAPVNADARAEILVQQTLRELGVALRARSRAAL